MKKRALVHIVDEYDQKKGLFRTIFGDTRGIQDLKKFIDTELSTLDDDADLTREMLNSVKGILEVREKRLSDPYRFQQSPNYRNQPTKLTNVLYLRLTKIVEQALSGQQTEINLAECRNKESLLLIALNEFGPAELFITEDKYGFVIDEYIRNLEVTNDFLNPYTNERFSDSDISRFLDVPQIKYHVGILGAEQLYCASKIKPQTVEALASLAVALLNRQELFMRTPTEVPVAQAAFIRFDDYYNAMNEEERECLNKYWIGGFGSKLIITKPLYFASAMSAVRFEDLHASVDSRCLHDVGCAIIKLVKQLDPDAQLEMDNIHAKSLKLSLTVTNFVFESSKYCKPINNLQS